jgi:hypothetical protein
MPHVGERPCFARAPLLVARGVEVENSASSVKTRLGPWQNRLSRVLHYCVRIIQFQPLHFLGDMVLPHSAFGASLAAVIGRSAWRPPGEALLVEIQGPCSPAPMPRSPQLPWAVSTIDVPNPGAARSGLPAIAVPGSAGADGPGGMRKIAAMRQRGIDGAARIGRNRPRREVERYLKTGLEPASYR